MPSAPRIGSSGAARAPARLLSRALRVALALGYVAATVGIACSSDESDGDDGSGGEPSGGTAGSAGLFTGGSAGTPVGGSGGTMATDDAGPDPVEAGGGASGGGSGGAGGGAAGGGPICIPVLARCDVNPNCCEGAVCVQNESGEMRCRATCTDNADCGSNCCLDDATVGQKLCKPVNECGEQCVGEEAVCDAARDFCCDGLICVASSVAQYAGCRPPCVVPSDCASNCCVPFPNVPSGFCVDSILCGCAGRFEECAGATARMCCPGFTCTTFDSAQPFTCHEECTTGADCSSGCCVPVPGTSASACAPTPC